MARLPRLVVPGQAHLVLQRGHNGQPVFADDLDRETFLAVLEQLSSGNSVQTLAWALDRKSVV